MFGTHFASIHFYFRVCHRSFEYKIDLFAAKLFRNFKFVLIHPFFIGNAFRKWLSIESDSILISAEALQFPTGRYADFRPFAGIASVGTKEVPFNHIVASVTGEILPFRLWKVLSSQGSCQRQG